MAVRAVLATKCSWANSAPPVATPPPSSSHCASTRDTRAHHKHRPQASSFLRNSLRLSKDLRARQHTQCLRSHTPMPDRTLLRLPRSPTAPVPPTHIPMCGGWHPQNSGPALLVLWTTLGARVQQARRTIQPQCVQVVRWLSVEVHQGRSPYPSLQVLRHRTRMGYSSGHHKEMDQ